MMIKFMMSALYRLTEGGMIDHMMALGTSAAAINDILTTLRAERGTLC